MQSDFSGFGFGGVTAEVTVQGTGCTKGILKVILSLEC